MALTGTIEALPETITALFQTVATLPGSTGNAVSGTTGN